MALKLSGYREYQDPTLTLTVPDKDGIERDYVIPEPSAELGLWCEGVAQLPMRIGEDSTPEEIEEINQALNNMPELRNGLTMAQKVMGSAYKAMAADGVTHPTIQHCAGTVFAWIIGGERAAERFWQRSGEAQGPANRAERRAAKKASSSKTTSTAGAPTSRRQASGSTTKSPRKSAARRAG